MKVLVAPNAFKGSLSAKEAADVIEDGILEVIPEAKVIKVPFSDGGDNLVDVLRDIFDGEILEKEVCGPLFKKVKAAFCYVPNLKLAAVEMAKASGLALLKEEERNPLYTTTYGTGELISACLDLGVKKILVGIGGSATNDGGVGMAQALGVKFLDEKGEPIYPIGKELVKIKKIDISNLDPRIKDVDIEVICDVENPLIGENGAARVYGPQKGAGPEDVELLEEGLKNLAHLIERDLNKEVAYLPGAGAAGGLGAGLYAFLDAKLKPGIEVMTKLLKLDEKMEGCDWAITSEGKLDSQVFFKKGPAGVSLCAKRYGIPCIVLAGIVEDGLTNLEDLGIISAFSIVPGPVSLEEAMKNVRLYLKEATKNLFKVIKCSERK